MKFGFLAIRIFLLFVLLFDFLSLSTCEKQSVRVNRPSSVALDFYARGMYRRSKDFLLEQKVRNAADKYLLARNYQELHNPEKAVQYFAELKPKELQTIEGLPNPLEHYGAYYIKALFNSSVRYTNALTVVSNCLEFIPETSVYREKSISVLYYYLWRDEAYRDLENLKARTTIAKLYRIGAGVMLGKKEFQETIFYYSTELPSLFYGRILNKLDPSVFRRASAIRRVVDRAITFRKVDVAKNFINRYYALSRDKDYKVRNLARVDWISGNRKLALKHLDTFIGKGRASRLTIRLYYRYLKSRGEDKKILSLLTKVRRRYPNSFNEWYLTTLQKNRQYTRLYKWFKSGVSSYYFRKTFAYSAIRYLVYHRQLKTALEMMDLVLSRGQSDAIRLMRALLLKDQNEDRRAYSDFLRIVLYSPFSYEWIVARKYESIWRMRYRKYYEKQLQKALDFYGRLGLKRRVYYWKGLKETDPEAFDKKVGYSRYQRDLKQWYGVVRKGLDIDLKKKPALLTKLRLETNKGVTGWTHEWADLAKAEVRRLSHSEGVGEYRLIYAYKDVFANLDLQGWVLSRLNTAVRIKWGGRKYHSILPPDLRKLLYPVLALSEIQGLSMSEDESYWILSAFREESHFRKRVFSPVGAVGYAQVMSYTARRLKRNLKRPELSLYDYADNILLGVSLYAYLFKKYGGRAEFALAAYNAGEGAVKRWRKQSVFDNELWVDCVEYRETRNYIKKIILTSYYYHDFYRRSDANAKISMKSVSNLRFVPLSGEKL